MYLIFYPFYAIVSILFLLTALVLNPFVALLVDKNGNLPKLLKYYQTFDAPIPTSSYLDAVTWLYRNPSYGFDYYVLGIPWIASEWRTLVFKKTASYVFFIAYNNQLAFDIHFQWLFTIKLGWKSWNEYNPDTNNFAGQWGDEGKIPVAVTISSVKYTG